MSVAQLVKHGGTPEFAEPLHVGRPNLGEREAFMRRMAEMWDRHWLTNRGELVQEFEACVAGLSGTEHCSAISNGTIALQLAIRALGLAGEVIVPSFTFVATVHSLEWMGIRPVFCDVSPQDHMLRPEAVEPLLTERTTGILAVHLWGSLCDTEGLQALADRRGLGLIYDAAHAFGCRRDGRSVGEFGDATVYSFHATKCVQSMEGGAIVTRDAELARKIALMKNFGFETYDSVIHLGTNGKMSEGSAAMGLTSLESMDRFAARNRSNLDRYAARLESLDGFRLLQPTVPAESNCQYVVMEVDPERAGIHRDELYEALWSENVLARRYFHPGCHRMEPYRTLYPEVAERLPVTERLSSQVLVLPTGSTIGSAEVDRVCDLILAIREQRAG